MKTQNIHIKDLIDIKDICFTRACNFGKTHIWFSHSSLTIRTKKILPATGTKFYCPCISEIMDIISTSKSWGHPSHCLLIPQFVMDETKLQLNIPADLSQATTCCCYSYATKHFHCRSNRSFQQLPR